VTSAGAPPLSSSRLFQRVATVTVGTLEIQCGQGTGLDLEFMVRRGVQATAKAMKPVASSCDLKIYGLSPDHRRQLEQSTTPSVPMSQNPQPAGGTPKIVPCIIRAGYLDQQSEIFNGELRSAQSVTDGPEIVTELQTGDGDTALRQARLTIALPPGSSLAIGLREVIKALGVGQGNLARALALISQNPAVAQMYSKGAVLKGSAAEIMTDCCRASGLQWSIQNGTLQFQELGQPLGSLAVLMDSEHGMIGSPTVDTAGTLSFVCEMNPLIQPGVRVSMNAKSVTGGYQLVSVETAGSTASNEWENRCEGKRY
jgi:hypothetical protein